MSKEKYVLKSYSYKLRDCLKDSWNMYHDAEMIKNFGNLEEEAKHCINDVIARLNYADTLKMRLDHFITKHNINTDQAYDVLMQGMMDDLEELKHKVKHFEI